MLAVSAAWKQAIKEQFRYQGYLRVVLQVTPPGLQDEMQIDTADGESYSNPSTMNDSSTDAKAFATLEANRWLLNGKFDILEDEQSPDDWWSTPPSDQYSKVLVFTFDKTYDIPGIFISWDVVNETYPSHIRLTGYGLEGNELAVIDVTDISSATGFIEFPVDKALKVKLEILGWNVDNWRARITEVLFGLYAKYDSINNGRLAQAEVYDYSSPLSDTLPVHTCDTKLKNQDQEFDPALMQGVAKYLARRQQVKYQWGFTTSRGVVEWAPEMLYYVNSFEVPKDSKDVKISATSRLAFLTDKYKLSEYSGSRRTLYEIAEEVLSRSKIIKESETEKPWILSETLKTFYSKAPVPLKAANSILQLIAGASACWLHTDPTTGYVAITDFKTDQVGQEKTLVGTTQELGDPAFTIQEQLLSVSIGVYSYIVSTEQTILSENEYLISGEATLNIDFNVDMASNVTCEISGATLVSFTGYSSSGVAVVKPTSGTSATVKLTVKGYEIKSAVTFVETYRDPSITHGLGVQVDNPFITETNSLQALTDWIVSWYQKRQGIEIPYSGYPEVMAGDEVDLTTVYGQHDTTVLGNKITFNGGFEGTLEVQ